MIAIENFTCGYQDETILKEVSFVARRGEIAALSAPSGEGKTTLLKALNRLHDVEESGFWHRGKMLMSLDGEEIDPYDSAVDPHWLRRKVAYVFQSPTVLPMSIEANVAFGLRLAHARDKQRTAGRVRMALEEVALLEEVEHRLDQPAETLSLGQKQRLAIARALVLKPEIILLDEPTSSLDSDATRRIESLMQRLKADRTLLLVSHDQGQIERVADRIVTLS
jgi:phosphate transport system ATP-binding protein